MKIYYICDKHLTDKMVQTIHISEVTNNLTLQGHDVTLFAPKIKQATMIKLISKVTFIPAAANHVYSTFQPILLPVLAWKILTKRPDFIYARQDMFPIVPALLCRIFSIPYVAEINGTMEEEMVLDQWPAIAIKLHLILERFSINIANSIIVPTQGMRSYIQTKYHIPPHRIFKIPNGANPELFKPLDKDVIRDELGLDQKKIYIGYAGSMRSYNGVSFLLSAFHLLCQRNSNINLILIGTGPEKDDLIASTRKYNIQDRVLFIDSIEYTEVAKYICAFDISICYYTKMRAGLHSSFKVYEYLSCRSPVVVSDISGMREEFLENVAFAPAENSVGLANAILKLIDHPHERRKLSSKAREFVLAGHTWKDVAETTVSSITSCLEIKS